MHEERAQILQVVAGEDGRRLEQSALRSGASIDVHARSSKQFCNAGPRVFAVQEAGYEIADREALHCTYKIQNAQHRVRSCSPTR